MSNLLLITDVARLRKIFSKLTEDKNIRLRVVNNLEKGGEEIAIEKPDIVFVQTHLSGLSAEILLMHLKKQLGRKRSRFVILAPPDQASDSIRKLYQGWLDTSADDNQMFTGLQALLVTLLSKSKKIDDAPPATAIQTDAPPQPVSSAESSALLGSWPTQEPPPLQQDDARSQLPVAPSTTPELSLEEQGITYAPRQRLTVYSEFNSSFDSAVSSTPEPEHIEQIAPVLAHDWHAEEISAVATKPVRSKRGMFLLWLIPVVIAVIAVTFMQQRAPSKAHSEPAATKAATTAAPKPAVPAALPTAAAPSESAKSGTAPPVVTPEPDRLSDKAVLTAIAENRGSKNEAAPAGARLKELPDFIPRYGLDKQFSAANPGWERYKGKVTEFKVLREAASIKAIQVIDRGGNGVPESFMRGVLQQIVKKPAQKIESSEKKEGYEIQRGSIADTIKVVYYRDETGGKLRAFVLTWQ